jgi:hypothetical protein
VRRVAPNGIDLLFIDGDHRLDEVLRTSTSTRRWSIPKGSSYSTITMIRCGPRGEDRR